MDNLCDTDDFDACFFEDLPIPMGNGDTLFRGFLWK